MPGEYWEFAAAVLGGGAMATVVNRILTRKIDGATVEQIKAQTKQLAVDTASDQIELMRSVNQEMRQSYETRISQLVEEKVEMARVHSGQIAKIETEYNEVTRRLEKLEERERHMLTRAATHEAWDQMAFHIISQTQPDFEKPPPLAYEIESSKNGD